MTISKPVRHLMAALGVIAFGAIYFAPGIPGDVRQVSAMTVMMFAMLINRQGQPAFGPRPLQRIWDERDSGEKFSIVMFHVLIGSFIGFLVWQQVQMALGPNGAWWQFVLAGMVTVASIWAVWRNWSNRNAR